MALSPQEVEALQNTFGKKALIDPADVAGYDAYQNQKAAAKKLVSGVQQGAALLGAAAKKKIDEGVEAFKKPDPVGVAKKNAAIQGVQDAATKAKAGIMDAAKFKPAAPIVAPVAPKSQATVEPDLAAQQSRKDKLKQDIMSIDPKMREALRKNAVVDQKGNLTLPSIDDPLLGQFEGLTFKPKEWEQGGYDSKFTNTDLAAAPNNLKYIKDNPLYGQVDKGTVQAMYGLDEQGNPLQDVLGIRKMLATAQVAAFATPYVLDKLNPNRLEDPNFDYNQEQRDIESYRQANDRRALTAQREKDAGFDYLSMLHASRPTDIYGKPGDFSKITSPLDLAVALGQTTAYGLGQLARPSIELGKAAVKGTVTGVGALAGAVEAYTGNDPHLTWINDNAKWLNDTVKIAVAHAPYLNRDVSVKDFAGGGYYDPAYYTSMVGAMVPQMAASLGAAIGASAATKNPIAGAAAAGVVSAGFQTGTTYDDLIAEGRTLNEARNGAMIIGAINGLIDSWEPGLIADQILIDPAKNILKQAMKEETKNTVFGRAFSAFEKATPKVAAYTKKVAPDILREAPTEALQQFAENFVHRFFDNNQDMWENVPDSFVGGFVGGALFDIGEPSKKAAGVHKTVESVQATEGVPTVPPTVPPTGPSTAQQQTIPGLDKIEQQMQNVAAKARATRAAVALGEQMQIHYPDSTELPKMTAQAKDNLKTLDTQANMLVQQHVQATSKPVLEQGPVQVKVGQTPDGSFVASATLSIDSQTYHVAGNATGAKATPQDAVAAIIEPVQQHLLREATSSGIQNQEQTQQAVDAIQEMKKQTTQAPAGVLLSKGGSVEHTLGNFESQPIGTFEKQSAPTSKKNFKLYEAVRDLYHELDTRVSEGQNPRGAVGAFYTQSKNITLSSLNNISTASHELFHKLDQTTGLTQKIFGDLDLMKEISQIYMDKYPGASKFHRLDLKTKEGMAVFMQEYLASPTQAAKDYPLITKEIFTEGGKYADPIYRETLEKFREIVRQYQAANPLEKIASRVVDSPMDTGKKSHFSMLDRVRIGLFDQLHGIEKLEGDAGIKWTPDAPSIAFRRLGDVSHTIYANNILNADKGFLRYKDGEVQETLPYNYATLMQELGTESVQTYGKESANEPRLTKEFGQWLVARRLSEAYKEVDALMGEMLAYGNSPEEVLATGDQQMMDEYSALMTQHKETLEILKRDAITREEAEAAYDDYKHVFEKARDGGPSFAGMFDRLVREDLELRHDKEVMSLNDDKYTEYTGKQGYASFRRAIYDDISAREGSSPMSTGGAKLAPSKMKMDIKRKGSDLPIVNPLYNALENHTAVVRSSMKQAALNKMDALVAHYPDVFQEQAYTAGDENDQNKMVLYRDYKKVSILTDAEMASMLTTILTPATSDWYVQAARAMTTIFTASTTGLWLPFSLTNFVSDQITQVAQTRNDLKPFYDSLHVLWTDVASAVSKDYKNKNPDARYLQEYMMLGGERQTLYKFADMTPEEAFKLAMKETKGIQKAVGLMQKGASGISNVLGFLGQQSELMSRAAEYIAARKAGKSQFIAFEEAARVTASFSHKGAWTKSGSLRFLMVGEAYLNASIQALHSQARSLGDPRTRTRSVLTMVALASMSAAAFGYLMGNSDDEQKQNLLDTPVDVLSRYIFLPDPANRGQLLKMRVPEGYGVLATLTNLALQDTLLHADRGWMDYVDAGSTMLPAQINPLQPVTNLARGQDPAVVGMLALFNLMPQFVQAPLEVGFNTKTFPHLQPIVTRNMQNLPKSEQFTATTSEVAKVLSDKLNMAPVQIDFLMEGIFGRSVKYATKLQNPLDFSPAFSQPYYFNSGRTIQKYFDERDASEKQMALLKQEPQRFSPQEAGKIREENAQIDHVYKIFSEYTKADKAGDKEKSSQLRTEILDALDNMK